MSSVCWDSEGILLAEFLKGGATINSEQYVLTLTKLMNLKGVAKQGNESSPHSPYSPDLASSDVRLLCLLKDALCGGHFEDDSELKHSICKEC
jgi:hypothetical protein